MCHSTAQFEKNCGKQALCIQFNDHCSCTRLLWIAIFHTKQNIFKVYKSLIFRNMYFNYKLNSKIVSIPVNWSKATQAGLSCIKDDNCKNTNANVNIQFEEYCTRRELFVLLTTLGTLLVHDTVATFTATYGITRTHLVLMMALCLNLQNSKQYTEILDLILLLPQPCARPPVLPCACFECKTGTFYSYHHKCMS